MKLRIRGNSIRLRLGQGEVAALVEQGIVEESTEFGPSQRLEYALQTSAVVTRPAATFRAGRIEVLLPTQLARDWAAGEEVSITADQSLGRADGSSLRILIEKDFACRQPPAGEDESDAFPHPPDAECKADE